MSSEENVDTEMQETHLTASEYATEFGIDESRNYQEFLKINHNIKPATSTQMTKTEKFKMMHNSTNKLNRQSPAHNSAIAPSNRIKYIPLKTKSAIHNQIQTSTTNLDIFSQPIDQLYKCVPNYVTNTYEALPSTSTELKIHTPKNDINNPPTQDKFKYIETLLENLFKEVKYLRNEVKELKTLNVKLLQQNNPTTSSSLKLNLKIPCTKKEDFEELEKKIISDPSAGNILEGILDNVFDRSLNKYISHCLNTIMTNEVALSYSWYGKGSSGKTAVQEYAVLNIIKERALKKFPTTNPSEFIAIATKWFHYARGRLGKP